MKNEHCSHYNSWGEVCFLKYQIFSNILNYLCMKKIFCDKIKKKYLRTIFLRYVIFSFSFRTLSPFQLMDLILKRIEKK